MAVSINRNRDWGGLQQRGCKLASEPVTPTGPGGSRYDSAGRRGYGYPGGNLLVQFGAVNFSLSWVEI